MNVYFLLRIIGIALLIIGIIELLFDIYGYTLLCTVITGTISCSLGTILKYNRYELQNTVQNK